MFLCVLKCFTNVSVFNIYLVNVKSGRNRFSSCSYDKIFLWFPLFLCSFFWLRLLCLYFNPAPSTTTTSPSSLCPASTTCPSCEHCKYTHTQLQKTIHMFSWCRLACSAVFQSVLCKYRHSLHINKVMFLLTNTTNTHSLAWHQGVCVTALCCHKKRPVHVLFRDWMIIWPLCSHTHGFDGNLVCACVTVFFLHASFVLAWGVELIWQLLPPWQWSLPIIPQGCLKMATLVLNPTKTNMWGMGFPPRIKPF